MEIKIEPLPVFFQEINKSHFIKQLNFDGTDMTLTQFKELFDWLKFDNSITGLHFDNSGIDDTKAEIIADCLLVNKSLEMLSLENNCVSDIGITKIADSLKVNQTITIIYLKNNDIGDIGAEKISECLKVNNVITCIFLSNNLICNHGAIKIAECLKVNKTLIVFELDDNPIKDDGKLVIADAMYERELLGLNECSIYLNYSNCKFTIYNQSTLNSIKNWDIIPLTKIDLYYCKDLKSIPDKLGRKRNIKLILPRDTSNMEDPPSKICNRGSDSIARYFLEKELEQYHQGSNWEEPNLSQKLNREINKLIENLNVSNENMKKIEENLKTFLEIKMPSFPIHNQKEFLEIKENNLKLESSLKEKDKYIAALRYIEESYVNLINNERLLKTELEGNLKESYEKIEYLKRTLKYKDAVLEELNIMMKIKSFEAREIQIFATNLMNDLRTKVKEPS